MPACIIYSLITNPSLYPPPPYISTNNTVNLPAWLGVGVAFDDEFKDPVKGENLNNMYSSWPWFHTLVDLMEMILVKSERKISKNYDTQLISDPELLELGKELRDRMRSSGM